MQFEHATLEVKIENLAKEYTYHVFYPENENQPEGYEDSSMFLGNVHATVVVCKDREELDLLLNEITEEYYETLKSEYDYEGIHVVEVNGIFLVSLEIDYFEAEKCEEIMNKFIVSGAQCDDVYLSDLIYYRKAVVDGEFEDMEMEDLDNFYQYDFMDSENEYIAKGQEEKFE